MKTTVTLLAFILLSVAWVQAVVIDFEDVVPFQTNFVRLDETLDTRGFRLTGLSAGMEPGLNVLSGGFYVRNMEHPSNRRYSGDNGSRAYVDLGINFAMGVESIDGSPFGLQSIDITEYSTQVEHPDGVIIHGFYQNAMVAEALLPLDKIVDAAGPLDDFQTYTFDTGWEVLDSLYITSYRINPDNQEIELSGSSAFDNLVVVPIPEPGLLPLAFFGGLVAFGWLRRRR